MGISKEEAVKELQNRDTVYVAYAQATKLPYVTCDEETYNDQVWIFSSEEGIKQFGQKKAEEKIPLLGMRFEKKAYPRLYGTLYAVGANAVVWVDGDDQVEVEIGSIARPNDWSKIEEARRPLMNPSLQLSGIYFMQELRKPVKPEERTNIAQIRELEEEVMANLRKSEFLMIMDQSKEDPKKLNIPYLKNKNGDIIQPVFSDVMELEKFTKGKKFRIAKFPFAKLQDLMIAQAKAFAINPLGINLILNK
jgi:hypothetical protein